MENGWVYFFIAIFVFAAYFGGPFAPPKKIDIFTESDESNFE